MQPPEQWPTGCRFRDRCDVATEACTTQPPLVQLGARQVRCHAIADAERVVEPTVVEPTVVAAATVLEAPQIEPSSILAAPLDHVVDIDLNSTPPESTDG